MQVLKHAEVNASAAMVWVFLWDIDRVAKCLPGCREVREVEPHQRYDVVVEDRIGPFRARFQMDVRVQEQQPGRLVRLTADGADGNLGATSHADLRMTLAELSATRIALDFEADIRIIGKIAGLGQAVIKRKVDDTMSRFAQNLAAALESSPAPPGRPGEGSSRTAAGG